MNKPRRAAWRFTLFLIAAFFTFPQGIFAQSSSCVNATLMCPNQGVTTYPASINAPNPNPGNNYGCLGSQPNPAWFYLHVGSSGTSTIDLTNSQAQDIDFAMWGPFSDLPTALGACGSLPAPTDCSFHPQANETITFPSANPGDIFLLLITNFSNQPTEITASDPTWPGSNFSCIDPSCQADAGDISALPFEECFQNSNLDLPLSPVYSGAAPDPSNFEYAYLITDATGTILFDNPTPDLTTAAPGTYQVCGISYHTNDASAISGLTGQNAATVDADLSSTSPAFCGDVTDICVDVTIYPTIPDTNLPDEYICPGECVVGPDGLPICVEGFFSFPFIGSGGCDSTVNIMVYERTLPESFITVDVCPGGCTIVAGQQVCAPGPEQIILPKAGSNGCDSIINIDFNEISVAAVIDAASAEITCADPTVMLDASNSTSGVTYEWKDAQGNILGSNFTLNVTQKGTYFLEISLTQNGVTCTDTESILITGNALPPSISTIDQPQICEGESFDLSDIFINDLNNLNPLLTYHSGTPATAINEINTLITPFQTTEYYILAEASGCTEELQVTVTVDLVPEFSILDAPKICEGKDFDFSTLNINHFVSADFLTYHSGTPATASNEINSLVQPQSPTYFTVLATLNDCIYEDEILVDVLPQPTAFFDLDNDKICLTETIQATYSGSASSSATFNWDFSGATSTSGTSAESYDLQFDNSGIFPISLTVEENGCVSNVETTSVEIFDTLSLPAISCQTGLDSILFEWSNIGASDYGIQVLSNQNGTQTSDTSFVLKNLSLGEEATILVTAESPNLCPNQVIRATCKTNDCPVFPMKIEAIDTICFDTSAAPIQLQGTVTGANPTGDIFWTGTGITDSVAGVFDPRAAGVGSHSVFLNYAENGCLQAERATIQIQALPVADFDLLSDICLGDSATITQQGSASSSAIFDWSFDGGNAINNKVLWSISGEKNISLTVTDFGCVSEVVTKNIYVNDTLKTPIISCRESLDQIIFDWDLVLDSDGYEVFINGNSEGIQLSENFEVNNLLPRDEIEITVIANSETACPSVSASKTCAAKNCPDLQIEITPVDTFCQNENPQPIQLSATVTNGDGTGTGTWSGAGVSADGIFDFQSVDAGNHTVIYTFIENNCDASEALEINIQSAPNADFTITPEVCVGEVADFQFSTPTTPNVVMEFDFNFSQNDINAGAGPLGVNWSEPGIKNVSFTVAEGRCTETKVQEVTVFEKLTTPIIECLPRETSLEFRWANQPNATDYAATILVAPTNAASAQNDDFSYSFENLNPGDSVMISLLVSQNGSPCDGVEVTKTCAAAACPEADLVFKNLQNTCFVAGFSKQLSVDVLGVSPDGNLTWSGDFVTPSGKFEPTAAGVFLVDYVYDWNGCEYFGSSRIELFETPVAAFESDSPICIDSSTTLNFTGTQLPNLTYDWLVENTVPGSVLGESPQVNFAQAGISNISLQVESNGCMSNVATAEIQVNAPVSRPQIECISTETTVEFKWNSDPMISDYEVDVLTGEQGVLFSNSFQVVHLVPKTKIIIDLTASGISACGPVKTSSTCATKDCPTINFEIEPVPSYCIDSDISEIQLTDFVKTNYQNTSAEWTWNGNGISPEGKFNIASAGVGVHEILVDYTVFGVCSYSQNLSIEVFDLPIADASAEETILDCAFTPLTIGGTQNIANPSSVDYVWSGGDFLDEDAATAVVERSGTYILTATDRATGCSASDEIIVKMTDDTPKLIGAMTDISCFGANDGAVFGEQVAGGTSPYLFAMNDDNFSFEKEYKNLSPGKFELIVQDANFCTDTVVFEINEPQELQVDLRILLDNAEIGDGETIEWGAEVTFDARSTPSFLDELKVDWTPTEFADFCDNGDCSVVQFRPDNATEVSVRVENENGCVATDRALLRVKKTRPVFIPSAFSPRDNDGINDSFDIYAKPGIVSNIRTFRVFDRWGGLVFENKNIDPTDSSHGWDGRFRGKIVDSGVYIYLAEVEFVDGVTEVLEGDVTVW